jgi:hypothetical protein
MQNTASTASAPCIQANPGAQFDDVAPLRTLYASKLSTGFIRPRKTRQHRPFLPSLVTRWLPKRRFASARWLTTARTRCREAALKCRPGSSLRGTPESVPRRRLRRSWGFFSRDRQHYVKLRATAGSWSGLRAGRPARGSTRRTCTHNVKRGCPTPRQGAACGRACAATQPFSARPNVYTPLYVSRLTASLAGASWLTNRLSIIAE